MHSRHSSVKRSSVRIDPQPQCHVIDSQESSPSSTVKSEDLKFQLQQSARQIAQHEDKLVQWQDDRTRMMTHLQATERDKRALAAELKQLRQQVADSMESLTKRDAIIEDLKRRLSRDRTTTRTLTSRIEFVHEFLKAEALRPGATVEVGHLVSTVERMLPLEKKHPTPNPK